MLQIHPDWVMLSWLRNQDQKSNNSWDYVWPGWPGGCTYRKWGYIWWEQHSSCGVFSSVQFSRSVMSDSLWPHESQHARPPCPLPTQTHGVLLLLLLSRFSCVWLCASPYMAAHLAPPSLGFSKQEHWSGLPFPSPMHEGEKRKWSRLVMSDS